MGGRGRRGRGEGGEREGRGRGEGGEREGRGRGEGSREWEEVGRGEERAKEGYKMLIGYWYDFVSLLQCLQTEKGNERESE